MTDKVRENRLRRKARRLGVEMHKSRARTIHLNNLGGYMLVDIRLNGVVGGDRYDYELDDVEAALNRWEADLKK